jgi:hypothetical protein
MLHHTADAVEANRAGLLLSGQRQKCILTPAPVNERAWQAWEWIVTASVHLILATSPQ